MTYKKFTLRLNEHACFNLDRLVEYYSRRGLDCSLNDAVCNAIIDACTGYGIYASSSDFNQNKKDA